MERKALVGCYSEKSNSYDNFLCKSRPLISNLYFQWPRKCERTDLDIIPLVCTVLADSYYYTVLYFVRHVADACECGNEPSGSVKCGEFLD